MQNQGLPLMIDMWSKVIWHKNALPPQTDGSIVFARWHQCAFPCSHIGTTWWTRLNLRFLRPTRVHSPNGKSIGFGRSCTAHSRKFLYLHWAILSPKLPCQWGYLDRHLIHGSLGPPECSTQTVSRSVQPFLQGSLVWQTNRQTTLLGR